MPQKRVKKTQLNKIIFVPSGNPRSRIKSLPMRNTDTGWSFGISKNCCFTVSDIEYKKRINLIP